MQDGIEKRAKVGVAWSASTTLVGQVITFGLGVVLARALEPRDFGIFASILIFTEVSSSVVSSGIVAALIQRRKIRPEHFSTALVMQIGLGVLVCAGLVAVSPWVGRFYGDPLTGHVLAAMSIYLLILPFVSVPTAILRKRIDFRSTGIADVTQQLAGGTVSVALALSGFGVWSLVIGRLFGWGLKVFHLSWLARWLPSFRVERRAGRELFSFGSKLVAANALNDVANNIGYALVGKLLGPTVLGFYQRAYDLMALPLTRITMAMNNVLFSAFSELQDDRKWLHRGFLKSVCYASVISFSVLVGLFWVAPSFIHTIYGAKWMPTASPLRILCLAGMLLSVEPIAVSVILARGLVGVELRRQVVYVVALLCLVPTGSLFGVEGVATAVLLASFILGVLLQRVLSRTLGITLGELWTALSPAVVACTVMSVALAAWQMIADGFLEPLGAARLFSSVAVGCATYVVTLAVLRRRTRKDLVSEVLTEIESLLLRPFRRRRGERPEED
jgi:PST family polysaccharide transporter